MYHTELLSVDLSLRTCRPDPCCSLVAQISQDAKSDRIAHTEFLEVTFQLSLIFRARLATRDGLVHRRGSTDEDLDVLILRLWQYGLQQLFRDVSCLHRPILLRWLVENVEGSKPLRVRVFEVLEFALQEDVFFFDVSENESDFGLVLGVLENCSDDLVHGSDAGAASNHSDVVMLVGGPGVLRDRTLEI
jgi:hypothetical protein